MVPLLSVTVGRVATLLLNWSTTKSLPHTGEKTIEKVPRKYQCYDPLYYIRKKMEAKALEGQSTNSLTQALRDLSIREKQQDNSPGNHSSGITINDFNPVLSSKILDFHFHYLFLAKECLASAALVISQHPRKMTQWPSHRSEQVMTTKRGGVSVSLSAKRSNSEEKCFSYHRH